MPQHTPEERARNQPARNTQRRRNTQKAAKSRVAGQPPRTANRAAGAVVGAIPGPLRRFIPPFARRPVAMSAKQAKGILAPRNSPPMSSFEKTGGITGRPLHNSDHG